jgi:hypothetical protein
MPGRGRILRRPSHRQRDAHSTASPHRLVGAQSDATADGPTALAPWRRQRRSTRRQRVPNTQQHTKGKGNIFQRLDDTAALFAEHGDVDLLELAGHERWHRLKRTFARRHVLTHNGGIVDEKFLTRVPDSGLRLGQRLVLRRADAAQALDDLQAVVRALAGV